MAGEPLIPLQSGGPALWPASTHACGDSLPGLAGQLYGEDQATHPWRGRNPIGVLWVTCRHLPIVGDPDKSSKFAWIFDRLKIALRECDLF